MGVLWFWSSGNEVEQCRLVSPNLTISLFLRRAGNNGRSSLCSERSLLHCDDRPLFPALHSLRMLQSCYCVCVTIFVDIRLIIWLKVIHNFSYTAVHNLVPRASSLTPLRLRGMHSFCERGQVCEIKLYFHERLCHLWKRKLSHMLLFLFIDGLTIFNFLLPFNTFKT